MADVDEREIPQPDPPVASPVPVSGAVEVTGRVHTSEEAADFGTYQTIVLTGTEDKQQILRLDRHRVRAWILVTGTGPVWIGSEAQCAQIRAGNTTGGGAQLPSSTVPFPVTHKEPVWLVGDGTHSATVVIAQERMQT